MNNSKYHSYINFFKCRACTLEFALFSWENDWVEKHKPFCPECGKDDLFFIRVVSSDKTISSITYDEHWGEEIN